MASASLKGKTALITGAGTGMGRSMALALAALGVNIIIHYNSSREEAGKTVDMIRDCNVKGWKLRRDLRSADQTEELISQALRISGSLNFLINSASIYHECTLNTISQTELFEALTVNTFAPLILSRSFKKFCKSGVIINILDARMVDYDKEHVAYSISKQVLFSLTRMMSIEFAPEIRVNAIAPGIITFPQNIKEETLERMRAATLLGRTGSEEDINDALLYLLKGKFITGETIFVDGGRNIRGKMFGL